MVTLAFQGGLSELDEARVPLLLERFDCDVARLEFSEGSHDLPRAGTHELLCLSELRSEPVHLSTRGNCESLLVADRFAQFSNEAAFIGQLLLQLANPPIALGYLDQQEASAASDLGGKRIGWWRRWGGGERTSAAGQQQTNSKKSPHDGQGSHTEPGGK